MKPVTAGGSTRTEAYTENERWYLALTALWADRLRHGEHAGPHHEPGPDIAFAEAVLGLGPGMRVFDLAAGWGRTSLEWARRGYRVTAFDLSPELIGLGRQRARAEALPVDFVQCTVRRLPDLGPFAAVTAFYDDCLLSFADEADNLAALQGVAALLDPGGHLLFGTTDCPPRLPACQRTCWDEGDLRIAETISFDAGSRTGVSHRVHRDRLGAEVAFIRRRRHYAPAEADILLREAGLTLIGAWNAYDVAAVYGSRPQGMVLAARLTGNR